jgi:transcriptional antiterminator
MDVKKLIKRLLLSQKDPDLIKGLSESEVAFLVAHLVAKMENHTKFTEEIKRIIEEGKMKSEEEYKKTIQAFQERIQGIDVDSINLSKSEVERMIGESR